METGIYISIPSGQLKISLVEVGGLKAMKFAIESNGSTEIVLEDEKTIKEFKRRFNDLICDLEYHNERILESKEIKEVTNA